MEIILASKSPRRKEFLKLMGLDYTCFPSEKDEEKIIEEEIKNGEKLIFESVRSDINQDNNFNLTKHLLDSVNQKEILMNKISERLAEVKTEDVFSQTNGDRIVIGSDTLVCLDGNYFGKPKNRDEAKSMLKRLSNNWHDVISSLCVMVSKNGETRKYLTHSTTKVKFIKLSDKMIENYISSGEKENKIYVNESNINELKSAGWVDENGKFLTDNGNQPECLDKAGAYAIQGKASIFVEKIDGSYTSVIGLPTHMLYEILKTVEIFEQDIIVDCKS